MSKINHITGYKRPPQHTQFQPGQSGNPKGRPKGVKNLATDLQEELEAKIQITEGNQHLEVTKQRAMVKSLTAKAMKGDTRAAQVLIELILGIEQAMQAKQVSDRVSDEDQNILDEYREELMREFKLSKREKADE